jgi:hypothetical protein
VTAAEKALAAVTEITEALTAKWGEEEFPDSREGGSAQVLFYVKARLQWEIAKEPYASTYIALSDSNEVDMLAVDDVVAEHGYSKSGLLGVLGASISHETIDKLLEDLPNRIERAKTLL